jgi:Actin
MLQTYRVSVGLLIQVPKGLKKLGSSTGGRGGLNCVAESSVEHPVIMTECIVNPLASRTLMSELMFEMYQVPSLHFGPDAAFSYVANRFAALLLPSLVLQYLLCCSTLWVAVGD